jgi:hypothetical protein
MDVIQAMTDGGFSNGVTVPIVDDCYHLASEFVKNEFEHNCCEANAVAHELARLARDQEHHVWLDDPPTSIVPLLIKDVTLVTNE